MSWSFSSYYYTSMAVSVVALVVGVLSTFTYGFAVLWGEWSFKFWWVYGTVLLNGCAAAALAVRHAESLYAARPALVVHVVVGAVCGYFLTLELHKRYTLWMYERATEAVRAHDWEEFARLLPRLPEVPEYDNREQYLLLAFYDDCFRRPPGDAPPLATVEMAGLHFAHGRKPSLVAAAGCRHDVTVRLLERYDYSEGSLSEALAYARLPETMALLLEAGANPQFRFQNSETPLMHAMSPDIARRLIEAGADPLAVGRDGKGLRQFRGPGFDEGYATAPDMEWWRPEGTPTWTELWDEHGVPPLPPDTF
ncbi:MAG: hypothetical protein R3B40_29475 [Polyangiales bacterium]